MSTCASCERELRAEWKFCITCGAPVSSPIREQTPEQTPEQIPGAIRPEPEFTRANTPKARARVTFVSVAPLIFSVVCFAIAGLVITWLAVNVWR